MPGALGVIWAGGRWVLQSQWGSGENQLLRAQLCTAEASVCSRVAFSPCNAGLLVPGALAKLSVLFCGTGQPQLWFHPYSSSADPWEVLVFLLSIFSRGIRAACDCNHCNSCPEVSNLFLKATWTHLWEQAGQSWGSAMGLCVGLSQSCRPRWAVKPLWNPCLKSLCHNYSVRAEELELLRVNEP